MGDSIVNYGVAEMLYSRYETLSEGEKPRIRAELQTLYILTFARARAAADADRSTPAGAGVSSLNTRASTEHQNYSMAHQEAAPARVYGYACLRDRRDLP